MTVNYLDTSNKLNLYIPTTDWSIVEEEMEKFNNDNENCFDYVESVEWDGLCVSIISAERASDVEIFKFGLQYGFRLYSNHLMERGLKDE